MSRMRRAAALAGAALLSLAGVDALPLDVPSAVAATTVTGTLDWSVAPLLTRGEDGLIRPASPEGETDVLTQLPLVRPMDVTLTLSSPLCATPPTITWTVGPVSTTTTGCVLRTQLPEGSYRAVARIAAQKIRFERDIVVQDFVIISIGDSNGSGEGNRNGAWANADCHRSGWAGSARAAALAEGDPHSRVSFIHLACSGGRIDTGLLGSYEGMNPGGVIQQPQLESARKVVGTNEIDAVIVSIGINNMGPTGFGDLIIQCLLPTNCADVTDPTSSASQFATQLRPMEAQYARLAGCLNEIGVCGEASGGLPVERKRVYATEYPDLATDENGALCSELLMEQSEFAWTRSAGATLNKALSRIVTGHGYRYVGGIASAFVDHGYCASDGKRWVVQIQESREQQGNTAGGFHPNNIGHGVTASAVWGAMKLDLLPNGLPRAPKGGKAASPITDVIDETQPTTATTTTAVRVVASTTTIAGGATPTTSATSTAPPTSTAPAGGTGTTTPAGVTSGGVSVGGLRGCAANQGGALRIVGASSSCNSAETPVRWSVPFGASGPTPPRDIRTMPVCVGASSAVRVLIGGSVDPRTCAAGEQQLAWALRGPARGQTQTRDLAVLCTTAAAATLAAARTTAPASVTCPAGTTKVTFYVDGPPLPEER